jgi:methylated-DNA-[protein]-cysteine S-methyltransferase
MRSETERKAGPRAWAATRRETALGVLVVRGDARGIQEVRFLDRTSTPAEERAGDPPARRLVLRAARQLEEYCAGKRSDFDVPVLVAGSPFETEVWKEIRRIPYGETVPYGELARRIGRPGAARAVGRAAGRNPAAVLVPCHRVVGRGGELRGYRGGVALKSKLLDLEKTVRVAPC